MPNIKLSQDLQSFINKDFIYALIGASEHPEKFGYKVCKDLFDDGYHVYPVNPHLTTLLGRPVFPRLAMIPMTVDVVIFVVPPKVTLDVLAEVVSSKIARVWFQPGSADEEVIAYCKAHNITYHAGDCIMLARHKV